MARTVETAVSTASETRTTNTAARLLIDFQRPWDHSLAARFSQ